MARIEQPQQPPRQRPGYGAGSEGWDGTEDPSRPIASSDARIAQDAQAVPGETEGKVDTQSDYALSRSAQDDSEDDGRFAVSEEQNFDMQSDAARRVGQAPGPAGETMGEAAHTEAENAALKNAVDRSVPSSE